MKCLLRLLLVLFHLNLVYSCIKFYDEECCPVLIPYQLPQNIRFGDPDVTYSEPKMNYQDDTCETVTVECQDVQSEIYSLVITDMALRVLNVMESTDGIFNMSCDSQTDVYLSCEYGCTEEKCSNKKQWVCPDEESQLMERVPTEANNYTARWCLGLAIQYEKFASATANDLCAQKDGGVLTAFENADEQSFFSHIAFLEFLRRNISMGSITVDGRRKSECINNSTRNVPPCSKTGTFAMTDSHTDPTYMFSQWYSATDEPDGQNIVIEGNYIIQSCIQLYILKDEYTERDGYYHDEFCDYAVSPIGEPMLYDSSYGALCGWAPKWQ